MELVYPPDSLPPSWEFDHIGVAVRDITEGRTLLRALLALSRWSEVFEDPGIGVYVQFGTAEFGPAYELIAPLNDSSPICGALRTGKGILNHVAYLVPDIASGAGYLRDLGCFPVTEKVHAAAYQEKPVQFFQSPLRFLLELIEAPGHRHKFFAEAELKQTANR
jgi:methylmalonyl-CoA/ethylmalonyl-CoA epimerase